MRNLITLLLITFLSFTGLQAQMSGGIVMGKVTDNAAKPLDYANILLLYAPDSSLAKGDLSDSTGHFVFERVASGQYLISASVVGLGRVYSAPFEVNHNTVQVPTLVFGSEGVSLEEIVVKAQRPFIELSANKLVVNVESSPVAAGDNALELLRKSPGVTVDQDNNISLKGKQGVLIMIDGKQTYLSNTEVARMLEGMPSASIYQIEIILNPSAKYDAAGNAGIINIKLKKDKNLGLNGNVTVAGGTGRYPFTNGNLSLNFRQKKVNVFGTLSSWYDKGFQENDIYRTVPFNGLTTIFDQSSDRENYSSGINYRIGADFFLSDKTTLGVMASGNNGAWNYEALVNTNLSGDNTNDFSLVRAENEGRHEWNNTTYNLNFKHDFGKGKELTFDADYSTYFNPQNNLFNNYYLQNNQEVTTPYILRSDNLSDIDILAAKIDYVHVINETTSFETGLKSSSVSTMNAILFEEQNENGEWYNDTLRSNAFNFQEDIHAAYVNFSKQFKGLNVQLGLRTEYTVNTGRSETLNETLRREYLNFFPSVSLSHNIGKKHSLSYSYSRRIDRPTYEDLNPFIYFLDQYTFGQGNPFLNPQYTHSFNTSYGYNQFLFITASYGKTTGAITDIIEQVDSLGITFQNKANLASLDNAALSVSTPLPITKWWMARINLSGSYNRFQSEYKGQIIDNAQFGVNTFISNNFTLGKGMTAELSGFYQSPQVWGIIQIKDQYMVNVGFSKSVLEGKGTLKVSVNDVFNTMKFKGVIQQGTIDATVWNRWQSQRFSVSFSYQFGNDKVKPARRRGTATDEEQRRANGGNN